MGEVDLATRMGQLFEEPRFATIDKRVWRPVVQRLVAENARLREALVDVYDAGDAGHADEVVAKIVRAALHTEEVEGG